MLICLVGGAVRDMLLGREANDRDYLVLGATTAQFLRRFPRARQVGKAFPVFLVGGQEFAFPREGGRVACCGGAQACDLLADLGADLLARDFTINALALPLPDYPAEPDPARVRELAVGLPHSLADLDARLLRPVGPTSLDDDPLRVVRAARFLARMPDFAPHPDLVPAMARAAAGAAFAALPPERVGAEVRKALCSPAPGRLLRVLAQAGALAPWLAELAGAETIPAGPAPWHDESTLEHTAQVMDRLAGDELPCWMALAHDLGKTATPRERHPSHHGHDRLGAPLARALGQRLALPNRFIQAGELAAALHMTAARYPELRPATRVDLLDTLHRARLVEEMFRLAQADHGQDHAPLARRDLRAMLAVTLPGPLRGLGEESGRRLRELRCQALARQGAAG
ncbi:HD domain-containing protein [Desulfocurvus vexinensis]|uniref:HD domain-containing protein n=1 Tax=Desulfocurvus vexinensis TaxID=399548 RepID=UPI00048B7F86|nr:HD domain-containing protein [Desulfocurvus vexinensis]